MTRIGLWLFEDVEELDVVGPWEVLGTWAQDHPEDGVEVFTFAREPGPVGHRGVHHVLVQRLGASVGSDEDVRVDQADLGVGVQEVRGGGERPGLVPRVVLGEGDVRGLDRFDARGAPGGAEVPGELDDADLREAAAHVGGRAVRRAVVDHHDFRALGQALELAQRPADPLAAVHRDDHHGDARVGARPARRRDRGGVDG